MPQGTIPPPDLFENWLFERTLPFWAEHGRDREAGGFHERLDADRNPVVADGKRAMVQARQIYVFTQAHLLGHGSEGKELAHAGRDFLLRHCRHPDGGWRFRVARDGTPLDDTRDLYTHAFLIYAFAWLYRLDGDSAAQTLANETVEFLDNRLTHPKGGYLEALDRDGRPASGPRRQNPHMHLFEAFLEWYAATGEAAWLDRANALLALFENKFCVDGSVREYFDDTLAPLPGPDGQIVEPGHHYEWVWLLYRYGRLTKSERINPLADRLYAFAETHGVDVTSGGVIDSISPDGASTRQSRRLWPQTEAIKAHIARCETLQESRDTDRLTRQIDALHTSHLAGLPEGAWHEHMGADGSDIVETLPASSLYHLTLAAAELTRYRSR